MDEHFAERRSTANRRRDDRRQRYVMPHLGERRTARNGRRRTDGVPRSRPGLARPALRQPPVPFLLTVDEVAEALRTTRKAVYALIERRHLPGVVRVRRRILVRQAVLLQWLQEKGAPSLKETER
jgi:excisionase family DNA binding protein